jgi:general secretion pathway protein E
MAETTLPGDAAQLTGWIAQKRQASANPDFMALLRKETGADGTAVAQILATALGFRFAPIDAFRDATPLLDKISYADAARRLILPIQFPEEGVIRLIVCDPFDTTAIAWAEHRVPEAAETWLTSTEDLTAFLKMLESSLRATDSVLNDEEATLVNDSDEPILSLASIADDSSPAVKLVNSTLFDALRENVSDVHLEMLPTGLAIKYRIDGVLIQMGVANGISLAEQVISRIKVMAELDIAEKRVPQDGRLKIRFHDRDVDLRVSVMPSVIGEDIVLRILDRRGLTTGTKALSLTDLGFEGATMALIRRLAREPYGMLLVTGPTGSGKTTTLYAALTEINTGQDKIITIEDPVEYRVPGLLQIPVNEKKGLTFALGLRSILRHDPDKILVGEIRDPETAQIAVQSALTGHLVLTSVHANNTFDVIGRFLHMGLDPYSFVSALNGIVAQRLLRVNCGNCSKLQQPSKELLAESDIPEADLGQYLFRQGRGCGVCRGTGFKGRKAIAEIMRLDDELREMIAGRRAAREIKEAAHRRGMLTLRQAALELVRRGETTLEEANRVTFVA